MIQANKLRIGNITSAGIVVEIHQDYFYTHNLESSFRSSWFDVDPIALTEEWLIKFNFTKGIDKVYFIKTKNGYLKVFEKIGHVLISIDKYSNCFKISDNIKYAHQLQNLYFALTGKELSNDTTI